MWNLKELELIYCKHSASCINLFQKKREQSFNSYNNRISVWLLLSKSTCLCLINKSWSHTQKAKNYNPEILYNSKL